MAQVPKVYCPDFHQIIAERNHGCIDEKEKCMVTKFFVRFAGFPQPI
jgi:hypothetical protein